MDAPLPELPFDAWRPTKETLHLYAQIVGKIRLALAPPRDHWWHVSLRVSARGLTSRFIPHQGSGFEIELDFVDHALDVRTSRGERARVPLRDGLSVAEFHERLFGHLRHYGIEAHIHGKPYDVAFGTKPFATDGLHARYDADAVTRFGTILRWVAGAYEEFAGRFDGKTSPVHFFWHSFDLAVTRFSGRAAAPLGDDATEVERVAYSHEVASFGFWPGDDDVHAPGFYAYAAPVPKGLVDEPLSTSEASWLPEDGMAVLSYDAVRRSSDPKKTLLDFCESAFVATTKTARWDSARPKEIARPA